MTAPLIKIDRHWIQPEAVTDVVAGSPDTWIWLGEQHVLVRVAADEVANQINEALSHAWAEQAAILAHWLSSRQ